MSFRLQDVVKKRRKEVFQQRGFKRQVGEESPGRGRPVQAGDWVEGEKLP